MSTRSAPEGVARWHHDRPRPSVARACTPVHPLGHRPEADAQHAQLRCGQDQISDAGSRRLKPRGRVTVAEAEDVPPDGLRVNYHLVIEIQGATKPACVAELIALHYS